MVEDKPIGSGIWWFIPISITLYFQPSEMKLVLSKNLPNFFYICSIQLFLVISAIKRRVIMKNIRKNIKNKGNNMTNMFNRMANNMANIMVNITNNMSNIILVNQHHQPIKIEEQIIMMEVVIIVTIVIMFLSHVMI